MTNIECAKVLALLKAAYPRTELSDATIEVYTECLADEDYTAVRARALEAIQESKFFPTVAELRDHAPPATPEQIRARRIRDEMDRAERERRANAEADAGGPEPTAEDVRRLALKVTN